MPIEWEMQEKHINRSEHTYERLYEHLLTTKVMDKLGVFSHIFYYRGTGRFISLSWMPA